MTPARDAIEVEALITDRYLESLLVGRAGASVPGAAETGAAVGPTAADVAFGWEGGELDRGVRVTSLRLRRDLPRFHPSFRFEERLALRLAEAAGTMHVARAAGAEGAPVPIAARRPAPAADLDELLLPAGEHPSTAHDLLAAGRRVRGPDLDPLRRHARPILIGGAVASAAVSLAGAAFVAWRRSHQPRSPMARAARAVRAAASANAARQPAHGRPD